MGMMHQSHRCRNLANTMPPPKESRAKVRGRS
jgi:hypothetical protein